MSLSLSSARVFAPTEDMAFRVVCRSLLSKQTRASLLVCSSPSLPVPRPRSLLPSSTFSLSLRSLVAAGHLSRSPTASLRCFSTRQTASSLNDPSPNWSNRPPKETILLDGCDFEHWLVVMEKPEGDPTRDDIIDSYIKTLAMVVGSEEEARMKIYSVSTKHYFAFGALVSEELSYKIKELPRVRWVLPDSYLDVKNKDYGGEPFIDGKAVPYDPKYHEEWVRNNARANERNRRNDRPRNIDRSRNFERRRENMQNRVQRGNMPPFQSPVPNTVGMQQSNNASGMPPNNAAASGMPQPNNMSGVPPPNTGVPQSNNMPPPYNPGGLPQRNIGAMPQPHNNPGMPQPHNNPGMPQPHNNPGMPQPHNNPGMPQPYNQPGMPQPNNMSGMPYNTSGVPQANNMRGMPPNNMSGMQPNMGGGMPQNNNMGAVQSNMGRMPPPPSAGWSTNVPSNDAWNTSNFQNRDAPNNGNMSYQNREMPGAVANREYQDNYNPTRDV
ncbi:multiple organellar RNA editing factor 8, chloroplastic/mitochondrial [Malania oleifera]|uniref:multiple organellar RNA editing factor 8, chloroplastic/mitochondrial n=1 Tax=Malania oleifera TaxID=397392 RepID=UPI0025ADB3D8|nr:multiple organellar RNA editing factor 8, chloroplastic/mitochondrial [Malania oleifera]